MKNEPRTAQQQATVPAGKLMHSANAGAVVDRAAQLRHEHRSAAHRFALEYAGHINAHYSDSVSVLVYEEAFGTRNRLHWLLHLRSLADYEMLRELPDQDGELRDLLKRHAVGGQADGGWDAMFVDGSITETALIPQAWGMYGTSEALPEDVAGDQDGEAFVVPPAHHQTNLPLEKILHSANSGLIIHRTAQPRYKFRAEARMFAREVAESINSRQVGSTTTYLYEEAFGPADRIHWLIHMRSASSYYPLIDMHVQMDDEVRDIYLRERIPAEKGGGTWNRIFVEDSMRDVAFAPLSTAG
jgi:hypothetical protein